MDEAMTRLSSMLGKMPDWSNLMQFLPVELRGDIVSRSALAATFLAALQLTKEGRLRIRQGENFGPLYIRAANESEVAASAANAET
jgi:segregation and condensation protein A